MSELVKISTKTYNSQLDEISNNDVDVYVKAKLKKRLTYGEYVGEPNNGFELVFGDTVSIMNLDKSMVYIHSKNNLNDNQQIVLEQLCLIYTKQIYKSSLQAVYIFIKNGMSDAYLNLDRKEASQVLEVFAKWAQEQEGEHD